MMEFSQSNCLHYHLSHKDKNHLIMKKWNILPPDSDLDPFVAQLAIVVNGVTLISVEHVVDVDVDDLCSHYYDWCFCFQHP